jgi:hypothetical protein
LKSKLYARELLKKLVTENELRILEAVWDAELSIDQKIDSLLKEK